MRCPITVTKPKKREVLPGIYLVEFQTQYQLAATFLRFQEHYESPRFRKRVFSLEQYMDWYASVHGNFTYYEDWAGFNIPSWVLEPFRNGRFDPLSAKEQRLLDLFRAQEGRFYIIGASPARGHLDSATIEHELAHALFHVCGSYQEDVSDCLSTLKLESLRRAVSKLGYARAVLDDEVHAYLLTEGWAGLEQGRMQLRRIFRSHGGERAARSLCRRARRA
jgi:hypothetical protein